LKGDDYISKLPTHPSAIRSQKWLLESLLTLMKEKDYYKITIKEITENADLDRSTFYRNFNSKEELLYLYFNDLAEEYTKRLKNTEALDMEKVFEIFIEFFKEHIEEISLLRKHHLSSLLLEAFNKHLPDVHEATQDKFPYTMNSQSMEFALPFNAGGMWNILMMWVDSGVELNYSELIESLREISLFNAWKQQKN
jgi:AcrR family transcriptional regulator